MNEYDNRYRVTRPHPEITPEEVLQDSAFVESRHVKHPQLESPVRFGRLFVAALFVAGITIIFMGYLFNAQIMEGNRYRSLATVLQQGQKAPDFPRGLIKDRQGIILASNIPTIDVLVDPAAVATHDRESLREHILTVLGETKELETALNAALNGKEQVVLKQNIDREQALDLSSPWFVDRGITVRSSNRRFYAGGPAFSHLLGYTGIARREDLEKRPSLAITETVGHTGVEQSFDHLLRGTITSGGERPGQSIRLTIDARLQDSLFRALNQASSDGGRPRGAAVAMDPRDGSIRALVSLPSFDNNIFARGIQSKEYSALANDPLLPLFNRTIAGQYAPGSTIKPFIAAGALAEGVVDPSFTVNVTGAISVPNIYNPSITYTFSDWKVHGLTNLRKAIAVSSNVYFYILGGGYQGKEGLGIQRLAAWMHEFGFGTRTGIAMEGEADGLLPTPQWKELFKNEPWTIGDTYHASIGQGDVQVTPIQLALATASIANGGTLHTPRLLEATLDERGNTTQEVEPETGTNLPIDPEDLRVIQEGMRQAVLEGSAIRLRSLPVTSAGKTGTAEVGGSRNPHAWFTGYVPYENPELVITVIIENAGGSSTAAMPIVERVLQEYVAGNEHP